MKTIRRILASLIVITLVLQCTTEMIQLGGTWLSNLLVKAIAEIAPQEVLPPVWSIGPSELGKTNTSGKWTYAIRKSDGYAVILGYSGSASSLEIPARVVGADVVGIGSGALDIPGLKSVSMSGNVTWIAEDAFGNQKPNIHALNGSYALYYASTHGMRYTNESEAFFFTNVLDFTDAMNGRVSYESDGDVTFNNLEASRLHVGDVIWILESHNVPCLLNVDRIDRGTTRTCVTVSAAGFSEHINTIHLRQTIELDASDFIPAGNVIENTDHGEDVLARSRDHWGTGLLELRGA